MVRILVVAAVAAAALYLVRHEHVLERARLLSSCAPAQVAAQPDADWLACRAGRLDGFPNLRGDSCTFSSERGGLQYWLCPAELVSGRSADEVREP
jgi:hypothetical protein